MLLIRVKKKKQTSESEGKTEDRKQDSSDNMLANNGEEAEEPSLLVDEEGTFLSKMAVEYEPLGIQRFKSGIYIPGISPGHLGNFCPN